MIDEKNVSYQLLDDISDSTEPRDHSIYCEKAWKLILPTLKKWSSEIKNLKVSRVDRLERNICHWEATVNWELFFIGLGGVSNIPRKLHLPPTRLLINSSHMSSRCSTFYDGRRIAWSWRTSDIYLRAMCRHLLNILIYEGIYVPTGCI